VLDNGAVVFRAGHIAFIAKNFEMSLGERLDFLGVCMPQVFFQSCRKMPVGTAVADKSVVSGLFPVFCRGIHLQFFFQTEQSK